MDKWSLDFYHSCYVVNVIRNKLQPVSSLCYDIIVQIMRSEVMRISHELQAQKDKIKENTEKIKVNKTLPYLVSNVIEVSSVFISSFSSFPYYIHKFSNEYMILINRIIAVRVIIKMLIVHRDIK